MAKMVALLVVAGVGGAAGLASVTPERGYQIDCGRVAAEEASPDDRAALLLDIDCYQRAVATAVGAVGTRVAALTAFETAAVDAGRDPPASAPPPAAVVTTWTADANKDQYNRALRLLWEREGGDWVDADGERWGSKPFARSDKPEVGVNRLVSPVADMRIVFVGGTAPSVSAVSCAGAPPVAVGGLDKSTKKSGGAGSKIKLVRCAAPGPVELTVTKLYSNSGKGRFEVFRNDPRPRPLDVAGLPAADGTTADIVLNVRADGWSTNAGKPPKKAVVRGDGSLRATIPTGEASALGHFYRIPEARRAETMFLRMVMRAEPDWKLEKGGKWPGLANTGHADDSSGIAGWGGRQANGTRWSARMNRAPYVPGTAFDTARGWGTYAYRLNKRSVNGDVEWSTKPFPVGRYFVVDQMVKLNSVVDGVAQADGEIAYWLDGELVNRFTGIVWRNNLSADTLPETVWADVYEGGTGYKAPHPHSVTFRDLIVSRKRLPFDRAALARLNGAR